jgi:hypothetical protein
MTRKSIPPSKTVKQVVAVKKTTQPVQAPVRKEQVKQGEATPPWPFARREVTLNFVHWGDIWKKLKDRATRDLERENLEAHKTIKALLDERDALREGAAAATKAKAEALEALKNALASIQKTVSSIS